MKRYQFRIGCVLLGWCPVQASVELRASVNTILDLEAGCLDEDLSGPVVARARELFDARGIAVDEVNPAIAAICNLCDRVECRGELAR